MLILASTLTTDQQGFNMGAVACYGYFWLEDK
jgi:hypothetical protein